MFVDSNHDGQANASDNATEENPGGIVGQGKNIYVHLAAIPTAAGGTCTLKLSQSYYGGQVSVFDPQNNPITIPWNTGISWSAGTAPSYIRVYGAQASQSPGDVYLSYTYTYPPDYYYEPESDVIRLTVVGNVDLDVDSNYDGQINGTDESLETSAGGVVPLGKRVPIRIASQGTLGLGTLVLSADSGDDKITVWTQLQGGTEIPLDQPLSVGTYYVEGYAASSSMRDVELSLQYNAPYVQMNQKDTIKMTVVDVAIDSIDANFAPSVENLNIRYTIDPSGFTAGFGKLEVFKNGDTVNPIYKNENITKTGSNVLYEWDGKANQGADSGKYIDPKYSPYTVKLSLSSVANFSSSCSDTKSTKVEVESITLTPLGNQNVIKTSRSATEIDTEITALVKIKKKDGTGVLTEVPIKIDWSFEDPDDTATSTGIDPNGTTGNDNAPVANGGKRGTTYEMWKTVSGYTSTCNKNVAMSETIITGSDKGKTKIEFSASAIAGDNYILVAQCKSAAGAVLKEQKSGTWSVRKTVSFANIYGLSAGVNVGAIMSVANIDPAFSGDGYTDYTAGSVTAVSAANSPQYILSTLAPNVSETPSGQELATYLAASTPDVDVAPFGDFPGPGDTDHDGDGNLDTSADVDVAPLGDFPGPGDIDHNGDGNLDSVATTIDKNAAEVAISAKAQAWYDRNEASEGSRHAAYAAGIGAVQPAVIGARYYGPKQDGLATTGGTTYYPAGIEITVYGGNVVDPDGDWDEPQGLEVAGIVFIYLNSGNTARQQIVGRHEVGHASDHEAFGVGDHATSGLMHYQADPSAANPDGVSTFSDDSILRLRGWTP